MGIMDDLPSVGFGRPRKEREPADGDAVIYHKYTCRKCRGVCPVYATKGRIRYHKCENCGHTFKSVEKIVKG